MHATNPAQVLAHALELCADPDFTLTWSDLGHPELEGQSTIQTIAGPMKVPAYPPRPGRDTQQRRVLT